MMKLDYEKYRHHLASRNLSVNEENELMDFVWQFMETQVDQAFGIDPVQLAFERSNKRSLQSPASIVSKKDTEYIKLNETIH